MKKTILLFLLFILLGCTTTREKLELNPIQQVTTDATLTATPEPLVQTVVETQLVYVEKPFYVPEPEAAEIFPEDESELTEEEKIRQAFAASAIKPEHWSGGMVQYDFIPDCRYYVYAKPLYFTDIRLQPGERFQDDLIISDSVRWIVETSTSSAGGMLQEHILIKPKEAGLSCSLIVFTDRRTYYVDLQSSSKHWMMGATWNYPDYRIATTTGQASGYGHDTNQGPVNLPSEQDIVEIDPDFTISYSSAEPPAWCPDYVYADGKRTIIVFPEEILNATMPGLWEGDKNLVNYLIKANKIIIPRVMEKLTLKLDKEKIVIEKGGTNG